MRTKFLILFYFYNSCWLTYGISSLNACYKTLSAVWTSGNCYLTLEAIVFRIRITDMPSGYIFCLFHKKFKFRRSIPSGL